MYREWTLIPARDRRFATLASSPGRSMSSISRMSLRSNLNPFVWRAFSVVVTSPVTTRRNEASCLDSLAMARMFTAALARASVTRASSPGRSWTNTLNSFIRYLPPSAGENARRIAKVLHGSGYGTSRLRSRGNRIASRMLGRSRSFWTNRSTPKPQPPWGGMPYRNAFT